jgi:hypothetical protein
MPFSASAMTLHVSGVLTFLLYSATAAPSVAAPAESLSVCTLSRDFAAYRNKLVTVRGVYFHGLRDACAAKCADGPWPSFLDLEGGTEDFIWAPLDAGLRDAWKRAKAGQRVELWVTVVGVLKTNARRSPLGPCDKIGSGYFGFGHLGAFPAQIKVKEIRDVELKQNDKSPYDYSTVFPARAL